MGHSIKVFYSIDLVFRNFPFCEVGIRLSFRWHPPVVRRLRTTAVIGGPTVFEAPAFELSLESRPAPDFALMGVLFHPGSKHLQELRQNNDQRLYTG